MSISLLRVATTWCTIVGMLFAGVPLSAADFYWDGDGITGNNNIDGTGLGNLGGGPFTWDTTNAFWWDGVNPDTFWNNTASNTAIFTGTSGTVTLSEAITAGGLTFRTTGYTLTGNTLTLAPAAGFTSSLISVDALGSQAVIASLLAGTSGFTKTGYGSLILSNNSNSFGGDIAVKSGQLVITNAGQLGTGTTAISITGVAQTGNPGFSGGALVLQGTSVSASAPGITINRQISVSGRGSGVVNNSGGLVSIGYNTLAGGLMLGAAGAGENRVWATHGTTTISGGVDIGVSGVGNLFQGNGNWTISGVVTGSENLSDRFIKTGQLVGTTLWLQNAGNNFTDALRVDSGTVRVQANGALGLNVGTGQIDLNNGTLEIRTDLPGGFAGRNARVRNNTTGTFFVDHDITGELGISSSLQNQTVSMGSLIRDSGANVANFTVNGRNGYNITFTSATPAAADYRGITVTNNSSGTLTLTGGDVWNATSGTASTYTVQGGGETVITGRVLASGGASGLTKTNSGTLTLSQGQTGTASTFLGDTTISDGTLEIFSVKALNDTSTRRIVLGGGALSYRGDTGTGAGETFTNKVLDVGAANGYLLANQSGSAPSAIVLPNNWGASSNATGKTLNLGGTSNLNNEIQGLITNGKGITNVTKFGTGTWQIDAPTDYGSVTGALAITAVGTTASSTITTTSTAGLVVGQTISGTGFVPGTVITNINSSTQFQISQAATSTGTSAVLGLANGITSTLTSTAASTGTTNPVITVASTVNLVPGQKVTSANLPATQNWYIRDITSATTITLVSGTGASILAGAVLNGEVITPQLSTNFGGNLTIVNGTLKAAASSAVSDIINDTSNLIFANDSVTNLGNAGGTFEYVGFDSGVSSEVLGRLNPAAGQSVVKITSGTGADSLTFLDLSRSAGATLDFQPGIGTIGFTSLPTLTNGVLPGYATFNGLDFVTLNGSNVDQYLGAIALVATPSSTVNYSLTSGTVTTTGGAVNTLKMTGGTSLVLGANLPITTNPGGLLFDNSSGTASITGAFQLGTSAQELVVTTNGSSPVTAPAQGAALVAGNALSIGAVSSNTVISSGAGSLTKTGTGTLILFGGNAYTGNTTINQGAIQLSGTAARLGTISTAGNITTIRQDGILDINAAGASAALYTGGTTYPVTTIGSLSGSGMVTNSGDGSTVQATLNIGLLGTTTSSATFSGALQDGTGILNVTKNGTGTQAIVGAKTYTGITTINAGTLAVTSLDVGGNASGIGASGSAASNLIFGGGTLLYTGANTSGAGIYQTTQTPSVSTDRLFSLAGNATIQSSGTFGNESGAAGTGQNNASLIFSATSAPTFLTAGAKTITLGGTSIGDNEFRLNIIDNTIDSTATAFTKADGGLWILNPLVSNTYTGSTTISGGALRVASEGAAIQGLSTSSLLTLNGGVLETSGTFTRTLGATAGTNQVRITGGTSGFSAATPDRLVVTIGGGDLTWGSTNFNPTALVLGSSTALGETEITNNIAIGAAQRTITVNNNGNTGTMVTAGIVSGVISGAGTGGNALIKSGGGVLILGNSNTYTGSTRIDNGNVVVTSIGTGTSSSLGASGAVIYNPGNSDLNGLLYVGGGEIANRDLTFQASANFSANRVFRIDASGSGALVWNTGTFVHTTRGDSVIRALTLDLRGANTDFNQMNLVLTNSTNATFANVLHIAKNDGGVWVLNPASANTFTGNINANGGLLGLTANGIGTANALALNNGGIFAFGGPLVTSTQVIGNNSTGVFAGTNSITINANVSKTAGNNPWTLSNSMEGGALLTINGDFINQENGTTGATQTISIRGFGSTVWNGSIGENAAAGGKIAWDIRIADGATFTMSGLANTYTGSTLLGQGTLILNKNSGQAQFGASSQFIFDGGSLQAGLALTGADKITTQVTLAGDQATIIGTNSIEFGATTALVNSGGNRFLRNELTGGALLTISGTVNLSESNTGRTLTVRGSAPVTISGVVANGGSGAGGLAYSGLDTLTLTNTNTATGALTVNRNNIELSGGGTWAGTVTLNPIGTLTLNNSAGNVNRLADAGAVAGQGGTLALISDGVGTTESTGALTLNSVQSYITISGGGSNVISFTSTNFANSGSSLNLAGVPSLGTTNKVLLGTLTGSANAAIVGGNIMPRVFIGGTDFATYDVTDGVKAFTGYDITNSLAPVAPVQTTITGTRTNGSAVVTLASTTGITPFMSITGAGIPVGTYVVSVDSATQLTLSQNATSNGAGTADFIINEIHVMDLTTNVNLAGNATRDAIKINGSGLTIGGATLNRLTLTGGGILNTGGNNTLSTPQVSFGSIAGFIQVAPGTTLNIDSALIGAGNWAKSLSGTLVLNTPTYISGTTNLLNGTTQLISGGLNTFFPNQLLNINDGATLDLNGGIQFVAQLSDPGVLPEAGGLITSSAGAALLVTNMNPGSTTFATNINDGAGTVALARLGGNTLTLESVNTYSGATTLLGGTLQLQDDASILNTSSIDLNAATLTLNNNSSLQRAIYNRVGDTTPITMRDGTISFTGKVSDPSYEVFGAVTSAQGANTITVNTGGTGTAGALASADVTFASLTRGVGTTVNFTGTSLGQQGNSARIVVTTPLATVLNGALGAWAVANSTDYAAYNSGVGVGIVGQGGFVGYSGTFASGNITEVPAVAASTTTLSGTTTTGLLRIAGAFTNDIAFAAGTDTLVLEQGGILRSNNNNATTIGTTAVRGVITSGTNELVVYSNATGTTNLTGGATTTGSAIITMSSTTGLSPGMTITNAGLPAGTFVVSVDSATQVTVSQNATATATSQTFVGGTSNVIINSVIAGTGTGLVKSGAGILNLSANNTYTGGTTIVQGTVNLIGTGVVIPAGGLVLGGANLVMNTNAGQIDPSNVVTIRRSSILTLVGNNTLDSLVFENNGGTTNPTVNVGGVLTLSNSTPVSITTNNALTLPVITGGTLALGAGAKTIDVGAPNINGQVYTNINPALSIASAITGTGSITKTGAGLLQLSGASTFSGLTVAAGGIVIGANSTNNAGTVISGPLGTGQVTMAAGTTIYSVGSVSVGNPISFAGTPTFDSTANTAWTNTFTGVLSGAGLTGPSITVQVNNPFQTVALLGSFPGSFSSITKTGLGTLIFNATNYTGNFNASALGNPNAVSLIHDGDGTGSVQTIAMGSVTFDLGIVPNITVNRGGSLPFPLAANKILAPSSITNTGLGLTVTNSSGYGLQVSDATAFTGTPTISVSTATASNVTQGLYMTGDLTGTGFLKIGAGTVVLNNATPANNTFTGNIEIRQGVVSVSDDALLGNAANIVQLNPTTGTSTFRATSTFATARTIDLTTASNTRAIEVTAGNTLTLNSAFGLTAATAALVKADLGTLVLGAANTGWTGNLTINAGVVSPIAANTLPSGTISVNETSAALQLSGGLILTNALSIDVTANGRTLTGLNTGGAFQSVSGSNSIGTVTVNTNLTTDSQSRNYGFGADNSATLNIGAINLNHAGTGTNRNVIGYFNTQGTGVINLTGVLDNTNASPGGNTFLFKIGDGTMNLSAANAIPDTEVRIYRGAMVLNGAATFGSGATQVQVWQNGTLTLDNSTTNTANRFSNRVVQIGGGTLNFIPNSGGSSHVSTGALQISQGANTINLASGGNLTVTFASLTQNVGATLNLTGTFGTSTNKLTFTTAPTLVPATTGLLARVTTNGNEFATYNATNGIVPFTGYTAVPNILSATATQTFKATTSTLNSLTGNQTLNALTINDTAAVGGLGGNPPSTLTLTSGGILANGSGGAFLNVPIVNFAGVEGIIHVVSGQSLTVNSGMSGTGGLTKDLDGTLNLNVQQFVSGNTYVNGGTLNLVPGATNTLLFNNGLAVNGGATVDLKNGVQFIGSLFSANGGGNTDLGGGIVTNSGAQATLVTNSNSNFNGQINGTIYLNKTGTNSLNLQQANSYSGPTLITGGTLNLADDGTILNTPSIDIYFGTLTMSNTNLRDNANRVNDAAPITMRGGTLNFAGRAQANSSETLGAVTLVEGNNSIFSNDADIGIGSGVLTIASLARSVGSVATLRFNNAGDFGLIGTRGRVMITSAPTLTNNLIGPWAVVDRELASYDTNYGVGTLNQVGFAGYSGVSIIGGPTSTDNVRFAVAGTTVLPTNTTLGTLTFGQQGAATTLDLGGNTLTIQGGALVFGQGTDNVNFAITNGNLTGPTGGGDLYIHHLNYSGTNRTVSIDAAITDNGGPVRVIKNSGDTGASVMTWNGTNTYTGGTVLNMGTLTLGATSTLGTGGITVYQATLNQTAGAVIPAQALTLSGPGTVTLAGNNTLTGISIINSGGGTPTITPTGILTLTGGITSTSVNAGAIATIGTGTLDLNGAGAFSINVGAVTVNGQAVAPWQGDLIINSTIQNGGITKSGTGNLQLGGQSTFAGGVTITSGGLVLASDTNSILLNDPVVTGPVGTGTLTLSGAVTTVVASGGARTITNNVVITGDTIFAGTNSITFNGDTTLPTTWNANVVAPNVVVTIGNVIGSLGTDEVNKSGLGTLSLGNYNGTINIAGGLIFLADGNTLGTVENVALGGDVVLTADTAITVNRSGAAPNARNKVLQKVNLTNNGSILAVNNQSGYGLEFTGTTTLTGASHFSVGVASASNLNPGLTLSGAVSDTGGFDLVKSGLGTLALTNGGNTFGGVGKTIDVLNGVLAASSDGALGNTNNSITLEVDGTTGVGFRAMGTSWSTSRTFNLNAPNNAFEVVAGTTFTLNTPFALSATTNTLTKNDNGIFVINADNVTGPAWNGTITINAGALQAQTSSALGSGTITINNAIGSALQLSGGVTISSAITNNGNSQAGGINSGGHIESVSGVNTVTGLITQAASTATTYGADAGATLNINGNIATANTAAFYADTGGIINLNSLLGNGSAGGALTKFGPGTLNVTVNHSAFTGTVTVNAGTLNISGAGVKFGLTGAVTINGTGTVSIDDTGTATANRLGGRAIALVGGTFSYLANTGTSTETLGALSVARPGGTVFVDSNGGTSTITFANLGATSGSGANIVNSNASLNFISAGAALGTANNRILFTTAPTLTNSIIQRATVNGADFATYGANGIAAFTAYNAGSTTNINSVTATTGTADVNSVMTTRNLTASRTINAIRLSDPAGVNVGATGAAFIAGGNTPAQLVLTAGGIIATGGAAHTISVPALNNGTVEYFVSVNSGSSLNVTGAIVGSGGLIKNGSGTLTISAPSSPIAGRGANTLSGNLTINDGTVVLNGGNNTYAATNFIILGPTGTLDLNGNSQLGRLMTDAAVENGGGIIMGASATSTFVTLQDNTARNWAGSMQGAMSFLRTGDNTLTMYSDNTYTGKTLLAGATTALRDSARLSGTSDIEIVYATLNIDNANGVRDLSDRVNDAAPISLRGGTINFLGRAQTASAETLGDVTLNRGFSIITSAAGGTGVNSAELTLTSLTQASGSYATVNFNTANLGQYGSFGRILIGTLNGIAIDATTVGLGLTNNIIGGWAEVQNDFATYIPGLGVAALGANGALQYDRINTFAGSLPTYNIRLTATTTIPSGGTTVNAVSMTGSNIALNFTAGTDVLNIVSGGLIGPNNNQTIGTTAIRGVLTAGGTNADTNPLYIYNRANTLTVNSQVVDNGVGVTKLVLTASGGAITLGNGTNSYTGGTVVNGGTVNLNATTGSVVIPVATNPADSLVINGGTVTMLNTAGQIDPAAIVTLNGNAVLNLFGANTLGGLVFRDDGGGTGGTGINSNSGTLTINGDIVSTTANPGSTSVLNGRVDFGSALRILDISATRFNSQELAALLSDFNIQGITGSSGGFIKQSDGVLQFNGQAVYTGPTIVNDGRLQIGTTNGGSRFSAYSLSSSTTAINLNGVSTILGSLEGSGYVMNSSSSTTAQTLTVGFNGNNTTFSGSFLRFNDATPATLNLAKIGAGTLTFDTTGANSNTTGSLTVNRGAVTFKDNGTNSFKATALIVNEGGTLNLDNSGTANLTARLAGGALTLNGGTLNYIGADAAPSTELAGVLTFGPSAATINLTTSGVGGTAFVTFASLSQQAGSTAIVSGTGLGTTTKLLFTTAPTLVPASTGILARVAVGTDFATYASGTGITAFAGYTVPTDINTLAATNTAEITAATTLKTINAARTINAMKITDNGVTIDSTGLLLPTQGLSVTSGGFIVNGNSAVLSTPIIALAGVEGIFRVNGSSLNIAGSVTGTAGITKTGSGSLTISALQSYTGQTALNLGNLTLSGGDNTILVVPTGTVPTVGDLQVNGGLLDLNGSNQAVRTLLNSNTLAFIAGEITNSSATPVTFVTAMSASSTFGALISGNLSLVRSGNNTLTLPDAATYTGATIVRGGGLTLQDTGSLATSSITLNFGTLTLNNANLNPLSALNPVRFSAATPVTMQGGSFVITPGGSVDNTTTINTLTILPGGINTITAGGVTGGTNILTIGNLVLPSGIDTTLNFASDPGNATNGALPASGGAQVFLTQINGATPANNSFLGANVIINSSDYGVYNTLQGVIRYGGTAANGSTVPGYAAAMASGNNLPTNISTQGADTAIAADTTIGALRYSSTAARAITFTNGTGTGGTNTLNIALGGLLRSNEAGGLTVGTATARGLLTTGGAATSGNTPLIVYGAQGGITIHSVIKDSGIGTATTSLVKAGATGLTLTAANTYTGGTVVNQGTLTITATAGAGTIVIPAGGITLNNASLTSSNANQIDPSNIVTINGSGVLTLTGANTLNSVIFANSGGNATPTLTIGTTSLILNSLTPITSVNDNYSFTPTVAGTLLTLQDGATISASGLSPIDLIISSPISTAAATTPLVKTGAGSLVLSSNTSAFANGFNLDQGSLIFANSSAGTPPAVTAGPVGTGTLTLANNVAIMSDGTARTIGNAVSVVQDFTFGTPAAATSRANAGNNLTLSGTVTLAGGAHSIEVNGLLMVGTISGKLTGGTNLTKTGLGTLVLSNITNDYGGSTTISAGTLQLGAAGSIPDNSPLVIAAGGYFNINGLAEVIGSLAGDTPTSGGVVTNTGAAALLTIGNNSTDTTFAGTIANQTNALNLAKSGSGTLTLTGANTYTGTTAINAGILSIGNSAALGTTAGSTTVAGGASLELQGGISVGAELLGLAGTGFGSTGALRNLSGSNSYDGTVTLAAGGATIQSDAGLLTLGAGTSIAAGAEALTVTGAGDVTVNGLVTGATATLAKSGAGTLTLSAANTYAGITTISAGILSTSVLANGGVASGIGQSTSAASSLVFDGGTLQYTGATVATDRSFTVNTGKTAVFDVSSAATQLTVSGTSAASDGGLTKSGAGTLTLGGGTYLHTGATTVTAGTLNAASGATLSGALNVQATGTFSPGTSGNGDNGNGVGDVTVASATTSTWSNGASFVFDFATTDTGLVSTPTQWDYINFTGSGLSLSTGASYTVSIRSWLGGDYGVNDFNADDPTAISPPVPEGSAFPATYRWLWVNSGALSGDNIDGLGTSTGELNQFVIDTSNLYAPTGVNPAPSYGGHFWVSAYNNDLYINYSSVPEPGSLLLVGLAGLGFAGYRRRKNRSQATTKPSDEIAESA